MKNIDYLRTIVIIIILCFTPSFAQENDYYDDYCTKWCPSGDDIIFIRIFQDGGETKEKNDGIYIVNSRTGIVRHLSFLPKGVYDATWGKDGNEIICCINENDKHTIYSIDLSGNERKKVINLEEEIKKISPDLGYILSINRMDLSPDTRKLTLSVYWDAYYGPSCRSSDKSIKQKPELSFSKSADEILIIDMETKNIKRITNSVDGKNISPAWSPDSNKIVFTYQYYPSGCDDYPENMKPRPIIPMEFLAIYFFKDMEFYKILKEGNSYPSWSVNNELCYRKTTDYKKGMSKICKLNLYSMQEEILTKGIDCEDTMPQWSPDGKKIVFSSDRNKEAGGMRLFIIDSDGKNVRQLTK